MSTYHELLARYRCTLATDEAGRLFDPRLRESTRSAALAEAVETLGALRMTARAMNHALERWADQHGLSEGRLGVIFRLSKAPRHRLALGELAQQLEVSPRNITGLVDNLERDGLVTRVPEPGDRRSVLAQLTEAGLSRAGQAWREAVQRQTEATEGMTSEELAQLRHLCLKVFQAMTGSEVQTTEEVSA